MGAVEKMALPAAAAGSAAQQNGPKPFILLTPAQQIYSNLLNTQSLIPHTLCPSSPFPLSPHLTDFPSPFPRIPTIEGRLSFAMQQAHKLQAVLQAPKGSTLIDDW